MIQVADGGVARSMCVDTSILSHVRLTKNEKPFEDANVHILEWLFENGFSIDIST